MKGPDEAFQALKDIAEEFADFCRREGSVSEADTRAKVITRVLVDVCIWPESAIKREEHTERGYTDYVLRLLGKRVVAVEAKREGIPFVFPVGSHQRSLKLSGALLSQAPIREAITQVFGYCVESAIRYAIATNGYAWIVFRAVRDDIPWRDGHARIFPSLQYIIENFTEFWNLLSYDAVSAGSLDLEFGTLHRPPRLLHRVIDRLFNSDLPLQRNILNNQLAPIIHAFFEDIIDVGQVEVLESCYVHTGSLRIVARDINTVITDSIPRFLRDEGTDPIVQGKQHAGAFGIAISQAVEQDSGQLFLLLGGIGSGKTTFIKRYQLTVGAELLSTHTLWFHVDFLQSPQTPQELETFVWRAVLEQLRSRYKTPHLETRRNIKRAFKDLIAALDETALSHLRPETEAYDHALSPYLERWQSDLSEYVPRLLRMAKPRRDIKVVLFIDNVDQLSPAYQAQIFMLAQRVTRIIGSITIVALREESYYSASVQRTFTAYVTRQFHIASPHFRKLISNRINFALTYLEHETGRLFEAPGRPIDRGAVSDFLRIVEFSIFEQNRNIARFIEAVCFGNMRSALKMFATFLVSGATDAEKMLRIHRRDGQYFVAFHEFVKAVMLGDRRYYKEEPSPIMNLFDCGGDKNSSHFTALRVLRLLLLHRGESVREGRGYIEIGRIVSAFDDIFDNREDVIKTLNRLVSRQLIEANTRSTDTIEGASHLRLTSAGWYYWRFLSRSFAYLDLVLQDTPINHAAVERDLRQSVHDVDNLSDREDQKLQRMEVRFERVRRFLEYLSEEENEERKVFEVVRHGSVIAEAVMPLITEQFAREREWIERRLRENRERYMEDIQIASADEDIEEVSEPADEPTEEPDSRPHSS